MTQTPFGDQTCQRVRAKLDSYIDNELLAESNIEIGEHFQRCTSCTQEAQERRKVRARLQTAVRNVQVPAGLEGRIRERLRPTRPPQAKKFHLMAIAATIVVCFGSWVAYQFGGLRVTTASQESYFETLTRQVAAVMRPGLGDHLHCAVVRQRSSRSKVAADHLPAAFKALIPIVDRYVPAELPLVLAHECRYRGRTLVHLTFRDGSNLLSLVIARKQGGESLSATNLLPVLSDSGIPIYEAGAQKFRVSAFESRDFLVYTVSDLSHQENRDILVALAPALRDLLNQIGA